MAMPSIGDLIAAKVGSHYASMQDQQAEYADKARLRQLEQTIRDSAASAPQQTQFAEPQAQQPTTLSGLMQGYQMQANPNVTPITQSAVSPERSVFETLRRQDPMKAQEYATKVITNAHNIAVTGDHAGAVDYINNSLGTSLKYMGTKDDIMTLDHGDGVKTLYDVVTKESKTFGTPKPTIVNEGAAISDGKGGWTIPAPKAQKTDQETLIDKRFANQMALQDKQIAAQDRRTQMQLDAAERRAAKTAAAKESAPGKTLPAGQLESIADMKRVKDVLAEASSDVANGNVSTGPVTGRLQSLGAKMGLADDGFVNAQQKLQTAQNIMLKLRSGAAVTESEYARFLKEYPTPNDPPEVFKRKMQNTLNYANTLMDDKMTIFEEGGYKVPQSARSGGKQVAKPTKQPTAAKAPRTASDYLSKFNK